jgi:hypothetical protein
MMIRGKEESVEQIRIGGRLETLKRVSRCFDGFSEKLAEASRGDEEPACAIVENSGEP